MNTKSGSISHKRAITLILNINGTAHKHFERNTGKFEFHCPISFGDLAHQALLEGVGLGVALGRGPDGEAERNLVDEIGNVVDEVQAGSGNAAHQETEVVD